MIRQSTATGGDATDEEDSPIPIDPHEDVIDAFGLSIQNTTSADGTVEITRDSSNNMTFVDPQAGTKTLSNLAFEGVAQWAFSGVLAVTVSTNQNNWTGPSTNKTSLQINAGADLVAITGIANGTDARILIIVNTNASNRLQLTNLSGSSSVGNKFSFPSGDVVIPPLGGMIIKYSLADQVWQAVSVVWTANSGYAGLMSAADKVKLDAGSVAKTGTAVLNFGATPGTNVVTTTVTGQTGILSGSQVHAVMMAEATATHNAYEHTIVPIRLTCGNLVAGTGFDITAVTDWRLNGTFNVRWTWF